MQNENKTPWGLDSLDIEDKANNEEIKRQQDDLNKQYANCFSTPAGKKVLEHLQKCTLDQPTWIPSAGTVDGRSAVHHAFVREGQNSIVRNIIDRINQLK